MTNSKVLHDITYVAANGSSIFLPAGRDAETDELITFLIEDKRRTRLQERYDWEHRDYLTTFIARTTGEQFDQVSAMADFRYSPEVQLFPEGHSTNHLVDKLRPVVEMLTEKQQNLFWEIMQGKGPTEIAKESGRSSEGVRSACNKLEKRIRKLYHEYYGTDPRA